MMDPYQILTDPLIDYSYTSLWLIPLYPDDGSLPIRLLIHLLIPYGSVIQTLDPAI